MPPRSAKSSATAMVTGTVAANIAIGRLEASMLDTATTSSITNSMKVEAPSSARTTATTFDIQAMPKSRSKVTKRTRQRADVGLRVGLGEELAALRDDDGVDRRSPRASRRRPATAPVHMPDRTADGRDQQQDRERGGEPVLRELAQQLVVECRRAAGRGELVARPAHALVARRAAAPRRPARPAR